MPLRAGAETQRRGDQVVHRVARRDRCSSSRHGRATTELAAGARRRCRTSSSAPGSSTGARRSSRCRDARSLFVRRPRPRPRRRAGSGAQAQGDLRPARRGIQLGAELRHGPMALVGRGFPVLAVRAGRRDAGATSNARRASSPARAPTSLLAGSQRPGRARAADDRRASRDRADAADPELLPARERARARARPRSRPAAAPAQGDGDGLMADRARQRPRARATTAFVEGRAVLLEGGRIVDVVSGDDRASQARRAPRPRRPAAAAGLSSTRRSTAAAACCSTTAPTVETIRAIGAAHRRFGTTGFLPTLISDDLDVVARALAAVQRRDRRRRAGRARHPHRGPVSQRRAQGRARLREVPRARRRRASAC